MMHFKLSIQLSPFHNEGFRTICSCGSCLHCCCIQTWGPLQRPQSDQEIRLEVGFGTGRLELRSFASPCRVTWAYNWGQTPGALPSKYEYVPMLWGADSGHTSSWSANAQQAIKNGATHLLGYAAGVSAHKHITLTSNLVSRFSFNEPDLAQQSNLTPEAAAAAWKKYMQPFAGKAKLCSPAITNGAPPMGTGWLDTFLKECTGCQIDCIAIHIYDQATNTAYYQQYIKGIGTKYKKPVWVTEVRRPYDFLVQLYFADDMK